ncbi:MAG: hypothetical protein HFK08_07250 [Clostridia bacterium]|nr:hypothetical protein [Clostridia bacterium]
MCEPVRLSGAKFVLCDECGKEIACAVTNENGELIFDCLPCGKYFLHEVCAPQGYQKSDECVEVVVSGDKPRRLVEFVNTRITGSIRVIKYGV